MQEAVWMTIMHYRVQLAVSLVMFVILSLLSGTYVILWNVSKMCLRPEVLSLGCKRDKNIVSRSNDDILSLMTMKNAQQLKQ